MMTELADSKAEGLREVEEIPKGQQVDEPPGSGVESVQGAKAPAVPVDDPEKKHRRELEKSKLKFAIILTAACTSAAVVVGVLEYFLPSPDAVRTLTGTTDLLKLLATTALGFIFGRSLSKSD